MGTVLEVTLRFCSLQSPVSGKRLLTWRTVVTALLSSLVLSSCSRHLQPKNITVGFYYWRSVFQFDTRDQAYLDSLGARCLYVKFFDVDWNPDHQTAVPIASITFADQVPPGFEIVPTVFVTNRTMKRISRAGVVELAHNMTEKIVSQLDAASIRGVRRVQIDCDWTDQSREQYFRLLGELRQDLHPHGMEVSVTIRLHQFAYAKRTGVPPVRNGVLMFYNMGDVEDPDAASSILDVDLGQTYLRNARSYPLTLDVALPLYRWGALFRGGKLISLIHDLGPSDVRDTARFEYESEQVSVVKRGTYVRSVYAYPGDRIRLECVTPRQLIRSAHVLGHSFDQENLQVVFYHLDPTIEREFGYETLRRVVAAFAD